MSGFDLFGFAVIALALLTIANLFLHLIVGVRNDFLYRELDFRKFKSRVSNINKDQDREQNIFPGWQGYRNFVVSKKIIENSNCVSIHLSPQDNQLLFKFNAGQYLRVKATPPGSDKALSRSYSISSYVCENDYRITVKKLKNNGIFSNYICDFLSVGDVIQSKMPTGDFTLDNSDQAIVLIAAGIGITPILTFLQELAAKKSKRQIYLFWGVSALGDVILSEDFENLSSKLPKLKMHLFISQSGKSTTKNIESSQFSYLQMSGREEKYILSKDENIIGSSKTVQVTIDNPEVASSHLSIIKRNNQWFIRDLGSSLGTILNKRQIGGVKGAWRSFELKNGDKIQIQDQEYTFFSPTNSNLKKDENRSEEHTSELQSR